MFAENNRISWLQMHCQCLLAALGVGLIWGIPELPEEKEQSES